MDNDLFHKLLETMLLSNEIQIYQTIHMLVN
jgi:hypothetical protein